MDFGTGTIYYTNSPIQLSIGGNDYLAGYNLVGVSPLSESESNSAEKVTLSYSVVNQAMLASVLGNVDNYRGRAVRTYLQLMNERFQPDGAPVKRWAGYMDKVQITRESPGKDGGNVSGKIEMVCSRAGMARARNYQGRRLSNTQHQQRYPGDRGFEYLQNLIEQPTRWLSKKFQEV
jgi:hypothetical protein